MSDQQPDENSYGANGPGSNMTPTHGVLLVIFGAGLGLLALGYIFRRTS